MVQNVKCEGVNFEENSHQASSNIQALISITQQVIIFLHLQKKKGLFSSLVIFKQDSFPSLLIKEWLKDMLW